MTMKQLKQFPNYGITEQGEIFNLQREKALKPYVMLSTGYRAVTLRKTNGKRSPILLHRLIAMTFIENPDNLPQVNHIDGDKLNNNLDNLEWVTNAANQQHAYDTGLTPKGDKRYNNVNPVESIHHVCQLLEENILTDKEVSDTTGVSRSSVEQIRKKRQWKDISSQYNF